MIGLLIVSFLVHLCSNMMKANLCSFDMLKSRQGWKGLFFKGARNETGYLGMGWDGVYSEGLAKR